MSGLMVVASRDERGERILLGLLVSEITLLDRLIREGEKLAESCPPGHWRWAPDPTPDEARHMREWVAELRDRRHQVENMARDLEGPAERIPLRPRVTGRPRRLTDGHFHDGGSHIGWKGHDGYPVHRHDGTGRTEWERRG